MTNPGVLLPELRARVLSSVCSRTEVLSAGITDSTLRAQVAAGRWQRLGRAIVLHNGPLQRRERWAVALANSGPRSVLTSFTALEAAGLRSWERTEIHVLAPAGTKTLSVAGLDTRLHLVGRWQPADVIDAGRRHRTVLAAAVASSAFDSPRVAVGLLAACVQQRITTAPALRTAVRAAPRLRHRRSLLLALADIEMGSDALSEIDFVSLCRRAGLPAPHQQAVRVDAQGRRRYLDAQWRRADGSVLVVEVDGAIHTAARRWYDDQLRQNALVLTGATVLRFPSVVVREEEALVVAQLSSGLGLTRGS